MREAVASFVTLLAGPGQHDFSEVARQPAEVRSEMVPPERLQPGADSNQPVTPFR